jgi:2-polyprenyl-3-methyl-5-hydroxy-6-metoxy-1,4-benzoquinol methylase
MHHQEFVFKEIDVEGQATLEAISAATRFNEWMYDVISARLTGEILEIGSGIGNISTHFFKNGHRLTVSDIRDNYCEHLSEHFKKEPLLGGVLNLDLVHPDFDRVYKTHFGRYDGAFALNVVEHIQDDALAIANCKKLLKKGGRLVILVPAYPSLYNSFDRALEHYRRYNKTSLENIFKINNLQIVHSQYFNLAAIAGWWFSGTILKKEVIPTGQMRIYNALVPIFKILDKIVLNRMGISVIVEGIA